MNTDSPTTERHRVDPGYTHRPKRLTPGPLLEAAGARLKWYDLAEAGQELRADERAAARDFVVSEARAGALDLTDELGFVVLHRAGLGQLMSVCSWRGNNELWLSIYGRAEGLFTALPGGAHRPTYCVWEMGAVWHESQAWSRYLYSARDAAARDAYLGDLAAGAVADHPH
ncbi:hypothetical protein [Dactylosporangium sp. NPDC048998]|uniref:hypothetical protein n=1 Tax=Dactylosporangium sp. NPDC048998 TaxID=3363976 RepID=UPI003722625B